MFFVCSFCYQKQNDVLVTLQDSHQPYLSKNTMRVDVALEDVLDLLDGNYLLIFFLVKWLVAALVRHLDVVCLVDY